MQCSIQAHAKREGMRDTHSQTQIMDTCTAAAAAAATSIAEVKVVDGEAIHEAVGGGGGLLIEGGLWAADTWSKRSPIQIISFRCGQAGLE